MSEVRDPLIKLFGADIHFPVTPPSSDDFDHLGPPPSLQPTDRFVVTRAESKADDSLNVRHGEEGVSVAPTPGGNVNVVSSVEEDQCVEGDTGSQEKALKRLDKVIPCPRCKSLNTKFCYFNNYNVNQPRHYCKNCQRYWTAGGTIRNVPVGAGKRKNKQLPLQYNQDAGSEGISQGDSLGSSIPSPSLDGNDETAKLCVSPLCESMVSMFRQNGVEVGPIRSAEEPSSSVSSISSTTLNELELPYREAAAQIRPSVFYYGSTPSISLPFSTNPLWTYSWIPVAGMAQPGEPIQTGAIPVEDAPVICTPGMNYPAMPYWGCMPVFSGSALTVPLAGCREQLSPLYATDSSCSISSSPNLGKHLRETNVTAEEKTEKCIWAPKSKKIDSMDTAAKCSILDSIRLKPGNNEPISKGGVFKAFRSKPESSKHTTEETVPCLKSNPAAVSRSQSFQESTRF